MLFSLEESERKSLAQDLTGAALKYRGKVNFATLDATKHPFFLEPFNIRVDQLPAFAIQTRSDVFVLEKGSDITTGAVEDFIERVLQFPST